MKKKAVAGAAGVALAGVTVAIMVTACGGGTSAAKARRTVAAPSATPTSPFADWSSTCDQLAKVLEADGFTYTASNGTIEWSYPAMSYGQLGKLGASSSDDLSHLSYLAETADGSSQLASDLANAGQATVNPGDGIVPTSVNGVSIYDNSAYDQLQGEQVPSASMSKWVSNYLILALNDCSAGN